MGNSFKLRKTKKQNSTYSIPKVIDKKGFDEYLRKEKEKIELGSQQPSERESKDPSERESKGSIKKNSKTTHKKYYQSSSLSYDGQKLEKRGKRKEVGEKE